MGLQPRWLVLATLAAVVIGVAVAIAVFQAAVG